MKASVSEQMLGRVKCLNNLNPLLTHDYCDEKLFGYNFRHPKHRLCDKEISPVSFKDNKHGRNFSNSYKQTNLFWELATPIKIK